VVYFADFVGLFVLLYLFVAGLYRFNILLFREGAGFDFVSEGLVDIGSFQLLLW